MPSWKVALPACLALAACLASPRHVVAQEQPMKAGDTFQECDGCPEMVVVPPGSVWRVAERLDSDWSRSGATSDGQCMDRIARGGGWFFPPRAHWFSRRGWWRLQSPFNFIGFRVAVDLDDE